MNTDLIEQNVHRLLGAITGAATTAMVAVGDQLGLYRALADGGPATQDELAARTGTAARYLREWLSQQAAAGDRAEQPVHVLLDQVSVHRKTSATWMDQVCRRR